ncbi:DUF6327 family protein [Arenibacter sp. F26102]|uniref:DUF6327 family protein n=1 Tax=Arenibacter sp. F26102 TaxID=2926416 RepID=UPI001FF43892|nr:DUF6327 family protein [Arenibacter sp. F26102]MCK0144076.1 DUF6327 family protein [Arenibacter sp. F26102]
MAVPSFNSFEEIDQKLRILKLQRAIDKEQLKGHLNNAKSSLYPTRLLGGFGGITKKLIISFVANKILKKLS